MKKKEETGAAGRSRVPETGATAHRLFDGAHGAGRGVKEPDASTPQRDQSCSSGPPP